jgi:hypothetical protein
MSESKRTCPVCGNEFKAGWEFDGGERPSGEAFPPGRGYIHTPATHSTRAEYQELGEEAYDGDACYLFDTGETEAGAYPPQPIVPEAK